MLVERIRKYFLDYKEPRYRDRRGWYISEVLKDMRDLYWRATGVKETNPTDLQGYLRMFMGKAVEEAITTNILSNLHWFGLHAYGGNKQIPVGSSGPNVDGYLDGLLVERGKEGKFSEPYVLEIKVKSGYGADLFKFNPDPGPDYMAQIGLYLRDLNAKKVTNQGLFLFVLLSDKSYGEMIEVECIYDEKIDTVTAHTARYLLSGDTKSINVRLELLPVIQRIRKVEAYIEKKELPPAQYVYKYPLTPEFLGSVSDKDLKAAVEGTKVLGDWQVKYSSFKDLHIQTQGGGLGYTDTELALLDAEYRARHPRSKASEKRKTGT